MSVEAFSRRPSKVPPATKAKPKKDKNYEEHTFQQKNRSYGECSFQQRDRSNEEHSYQQRSKVECSYEDSLQQKSSGNFRRESDDKGDGTNDFSKMIALAAARRQGKMPSAGTQDLSADSRHSQFPVAKQNEASQFAPSKLSVTGSSHSVGRSPPSPIPPPRNAFQSATLPHSASFQMAKSFLQAQAPQSPSTTFQHRASSPSLSLHAPSPTPPTLSHELQAHYPQSSSQTPQQSFAQDDEIYDDVESMMPNVPSSSLSIDTKQSQPFGSASGVTPPTIPSTPRPSLVNLQRSNSQLLNRPPISLSDSGNTQPREDSGSSVGGSSLSKPMSMCEFVSQYHDELPVKLKVVDVPHGIQGLMKGDVLNVHVSKTTRVAVVSDSNKAQFIVPFNSAIKFGILYNPVGNTNAATQGYQFATVGEITSLASLPPVICARASYEVSSAESSVQKNDILIVKEVKNHRRGRCLICIDTKSKQKKKLLESCPGNFSTSPLDTSLHLPDVIANVPLPQQCIVSYNGPSGAEVTSRLPKGYVVIRSTAVNKTVVASKEGSYVPVEDMIRQSSHYLLEIPATLDATVQVISTSDSITKQLLQDSCAIHQKLSTANFGMNLCYILPGSNQHQLTFLSMIRPDKPHSGVVLTCPTRAVNSIPHSSSAPNLAEENEMAEDEYDIPQVAMQNFLDKQQPITESYYAAPRSASVPPVSDSASSDIYDVPGNNAPLIPTTTQVPSMTTQVPSMALKIGQMAPKVGQMAPRVASVVQRVPSPTPRPQASESPGLPQEVEDIRKIVERLEKDFTNLKQETSALRKEVTTLKQQLSQQGKRQGLRPMAELETAQQVAAVLSDPHQNKDILATFSCQQVQQLLREMNLEPYVDIFAQEQINGSLLMDCNEHVLRDLGVSSKLHQLRLMNLITGKKSSAKITSEKDHYVTCYKS